MAMNDLPAPAGDWAVLLDVDGTLIEIAAHPDAVQPAANLPDILRDLSTALDGALALVSGRSIAEVDRLTGGLGLAAAGLHGLETRTADGVYQAAAENSPAMDAAREQLRALAQEDDGLYLEDKTATLALHYRGAPQAGERALETGEDIVRRADGRLDILAGKAVFEIKPTGYDKGRALHQLMAGAPFHGRRPVYIGDDVTDEYAFAAANELNGVAIHVGDNADSTAPYQLNTVDEVLEWLQRVAKTLTDRVERPT